MALADAAHAVATAIDQLLTAVRDQAATGEVTPTLKALKVSSSRLDAAIGQLTHTADAAGEFIGTGSRDTAEWLAKETGTSTRRNRVAAELGAAMSKSDDFADAVTDGTISADKASAIVGAAGDEVIDDGLLDRVADLPLDAIRPAVEEWRAKQHPDRDADIAQVQRDRRYLRLTGQPDGMTRIDGLLDPLSASKVRSTLDAVMSESAFDDAIRTRDQRCADALTQLCDAASKGKLAGGRSNSKLLAVVPFETVVERGTARGRTHVGPTLDAAAIRQLACDAGIHRVVTGPASSVLDFGHETRLVSENLFNALVVRDQHCRWPGCTIRATWCDAHHIIEWTDNGATDLANTALLCHRHHQLGHQAGWKISGVGDRIEIHHPNGSVEVSTPPGVPTHRADTIGGMPPDEAARPTGRLPATQLALV